MGFQLCPLCKGFKGNFICEVCKDKKIIDEVTGLPPISVKTKDATIRINGIELICDPNLKDNEYYLVDLNGIKHKI